MMPQYSISYDISESSKVKYEDLEKVIKENCNGYCKYSMSSWIVDYSGNAQNLSDKITNLGFGNNDRLLVIKVVNDKQGWLDKDDWRIINSFFK